MIACRVILDIRGQAVVEESTIMDSNILGSSLYVLEEDPMPYETPIPQQYPLDA